MEDVLAHSLLALHTTTNNTNKKEKEIAAAQQQEPRQTKRKWKGSPLTTIPEWSPTSVLSDLAAA